MLPFGPLEFLLILIIFMIFFGAGKLGDLGGALNKSIKEFKANAGWGEKKKLDTPDQNKPVA